MKPNNSAVVVLSGGQDSMTCLGLALKQYHEVHAIGFAYGQRHRVELEQAAQACAKHDVPFRVVSLDFMPQLVTSALTGEGDVGAGHAYKPGLPASFVPARNALFLTLSHAYAQELGAKTILTGVCETDYSGYPDCREAFILELANALNIGYETDIQIRTPLMHMTKSETFELASRTGFLTEVLNLSHTCYNGNRDRINDWGFGCGECPACKLRAEGWAQFQVGNIRDEVVQRELWQ